MEPKPSRAPLIAIVGETASGKTALALEMAEKFNGEIIAADSRTIYKGLDIGTAKPTPKERQQVRHHLLDIVEPDQQCSAAQFKELAQKAIQDITSRGKVPFLVGGSGLYIDAVLYDFSFRTPADTTLRAELSRLSVDELQQRLLEESIALPSNERNPRHLIRAIETKGIPPTMQPLREDTLIIGLKADRGTLQNTLEQRVKHMVQAGFIEEVKWAHKRYGWQAPGLQAPGYKAFRAYLDGDISLEEAEELFVRNDMQLAKRQRTWFKRNKSIHYISKKEEAVDLITTFLNK